MRMIPSVMFLSAMLAATTAQASPMNLTVSVDGITPGKPIPATQALCLPTPDGKSDKTGQNIRPEIRWSGAPTGTASFAVFMMDPDVPADFTDAGKDGKIIATKAKRQDFFHYGVVSIPATATTLAGSLTNKSADMGTELVNDLGINHYVDPATAFGGPCPPWNDARIHHYHFMVLALDADADALINAPSAVDCTDPACRADTAKATFSRLITSTHVLAKGAVVGTYSLNPHVKP